MKRNVLLPLFLIALAGSCGGKGCSCTPKQECELLRALCKMDVCVKTDPDGWYACQLLPTSCEKDGQCVTRQQCIETFFARCPGRMVPGAPGYPDYSKCANLDCNEPRPPIDAGRPRPDAGTNRDAAPPPQDASVSSPDAGPMCAGVMCGGACCTAYPCFTPDGCTCEASAADCVPDPGGGTAISPTCCSDAPLCSAQGKQCCFVPASGGTPAETLCLTSCSSAARHCTFAPYKQSDGVTSCLPPPYDTSGVACPF